MLIAQGMACVRACCVQVLEDASAQPDSRVDAKAAKAAVIQVAAQARRIRMHNN